MKRIALSVALSTWILIWLWGIGQFQWTPGTRAIAFFLYFSVSVFILDRGYCWIRPSTDWSVRSGLSMIMLLSFVGISAGHYMLSRWLEIELQLIPSIERYPLKQEMPVIWSAVVGVLHALIIGIMGMTVLIWRKPE